jgi:hypothetical protein
MESFWSVYLAAIASAAFFLILGTTGLVKRRAFVLPGYLVLAGDQHDIHHFDPPDI